MNITTHPELVAALVKPGEQILRELTPSDCNLIHMAVGLAGEASGELLDAIKAHVIYRKPLNMQNIIEELGDIEFYLEGLRQELKIPREDCLEENIRKLSRRYDTLKYSDTAAVERADKK